MGTNQLDTGAFRGPRKIVVTSPSFSKNPILRAETSSFFDDVVFFDTEGRLADEALWNHCRGAEGVVVGLEMIDDRFFRECPTVRIVSKYGVGLDNIDLDACQKHRVTVGWVPGVNRLSVAEMTLGFMLMQIRRLFVGANILKVGRWVKDGGFQLSGKTVGIIGLGHIGREVVRLLRPFGCRLLGNDILPMEDFFREEAVEPASKDAIFREADIVTLHVPLSEKTRGLVSRRELEMMKSSAFLINTSRGSIVVQNELKKALREGRIAGAALDVYEEEPPSDLEFLALPNLICTPHIGGNAQEAVLAMGRSAIEQLRVFFSEEGNGRKE